MNPTDLAPESHDVVLGGMRFNYLEWEGSEETVVLLHGGALNAHSWDGVCHDLGPDYRRIAPDLRGHGDSEWSPVADYRLNSHIRDVERFLDRVAPERFFLVGHSLGGHIALRYAALHGKRLKALVVVDTCPFVQPQAAIDKLREFLTGRNAFTQFEDAIDYVLGYEPYRDADQLRRSLQFALRQTPDGSWTWKSDRRHLTQAYFDQAMRELRSLENDLHAIKCPVLLVRGEHGVVSSADAEEFVRLLPGARVVTIASAGHNVHSDDPRALAYEIGCFIDELKGLEQWRSESR